jgi:serine phosphatase RsbU (regulator of sigma subunit)/signal transduction protein with GAF and PtsI domain
VSNSNSEQARKSPRSHPGWSTAYSLLVGLTGLGIVGYQLVGSWAELDWMAILVFIGLSLLVQRSSFHFGSPVMHSLAGVIDLAAVLAVGPTAGAVVAALSGLIYLEASALRHQRLTRRDLLQIPLFNAGLKAFMALLSGILFQAIAGPLPIDGVVQASNSGVYWTSVLAVCTVSLLWFSLDHIGWGILDYLEGGPEQVRAYLRAAFPQALLLELLPLPSSVVVSLVYVYLGWPAFILVGMVIIAVAVLTQHWAGARRELERRVAELSSVEQIGSAIVQAELDVDELCRLLYEHTSRIADATIFQLGLFDGERYAIKLWMQEGQARPQRVFQMTPGVGLVNWLRESKQPLLVQDFEKDIDSLPARPRYVSDSPPRSALFVPLMAGKTVIGTTSIQSYRRNAYGEDDLRVLSAMANQAAMAIQKAQLYAQERKRARQLETIGQISRQVTATMELDELFQRAVYLIRENFGYYHVTLYTVDPEMEVVQFEASASAGERQVSAVVEWDEGLIGWVAANAQAAVVNDVENDTRYRCVAALDETRSELTVPLLLEDEIVGVLDVQSDQLGAFGSDDLFILETLGDQLAIAIQEARLYEAERQQAWLSTALLQVAEAMGQISDMDAVLSTVVRLTPLLAGVDRCTILLWESETETFRPTQTYGLAPELRETFEQYQFQAGSIPALDLVRWDKSPLLVRTDTEGKLIPQSLAERFDIHEMLLLPLLAQGELLGVMMVDYAGRAHPFTERLIDMLTGIANQAAMVIHSARLVQAQREEAYASMALLQVAEAVNRSTDLDEILQAIVRIMPILLGVNTCAVFLWDPSTSTFLPSRQYGLESPARSAFWDLRLSTDTPPIPELMAGVPYVILEEPTTTIAPLGDGTTALALPLSSKGDILGAMFVDSGESSQQLTERWMNILTGIAGQAAVAVENHRLLEEAAEQERMKQELEVGRRIQASFLPEHSTEIRGWDLAVIWRSARQVSGDFYDFIPLPASSSQPTGRHSPTAGEKFAPGLERMGVVIADVADKGVPAALFMALSRTLMRTMAIDGRPPAAAAEWANKLIVADARAELFVTLFYTILQSDSGEIIYINAGHMPPLVVRAASGKADELRIHGMAMGILPEVEYEEGMAYLAPGDILVLYTDGVTEALDAENQMFGKERLLETVQTHRHRSAEGICQAIDKAVASFVGDVRQFDDFTLLIAKRSA